MNQALKMTVETPEGQKEVAYQSWYNPNKLPESLVFCVHGLTRNRHDFDYLAEKLAQDHQVICVDVLGRGDSDWMETPEQYGYPLYVAQLQQMMSYWLEKTEFDRVDWVGTSMGGLIGMTIAAQPDTKIDRLVLNDVGTYIPLVAIQRLKHYVGKAPRLSSIEEVESYLRDIARSFGELTDMQWRRLAEYSAEEIQPGEWRFRYDPTIRNAFDIVDGDIDLNPLWQSTSCPVLIIRGEDSDILTKENAQKMIERPDTKLIEFPNVGHAPMLLSEKQVLPIEQFLK